MTTLLRSNTTLVWAVLVALTVSSWTAGTHGSPGTHMALSLVIIAIAVFKARLVGLYFMELREAPRWLRAGFEGYCAVVFVLLASMFVLL
ncbi:hypothetical protein FR943_06195 [Mycobacterium sp. TNTM28]|uniref:Prokaryotic cytochrome C oxidase subunit IV family protein n=1 Tax=[Mycobacterium] fortunisiensis TaxID=2600579 RepID=A0ABS6KIP0_9MYCO|nr:cytochrome C oxidase subunit IV family protein [[Mycobacterium] fortunisiensis]MBU9763432.1 hypothetical protein [[Mycobacterium] fortunisiensis]